MRAVLDMAAIYPPSPALRSGSLTAVKFASKLQGVGGVMGNL